MTRRSPNVIQIEIANQQRFVKLDRKRLREAVRRVLAAHGIQSAEISIAVVDDATIHDLNRRYLEHDYATDVLSFVLDQTNGHLDGEVIASAETAARVASELDVCAGEELLLYLIHGMLHLVGFDDQTPAEARRMRSEEREILRRLGTSESKPPQTRSPARASKSKAGRTQR